MNIPKLSLDSLEIKNNYYIVEDEFFHKFHYFAIKVDTAGANEHIIKFLKTPPVLMEGIAVIGKKLYFVTLKDLQRLIIRKSREIGENINNGIESSVSISESGAQSSGPIFSTGSAVPDSNQRSAGTQAGVEELQSVDDAWEGQIQALLHSISEKEGGQWEIADIAQP